MQRLLNYLINPILPPICVGCGDHGDMQTASDGVCAECWADLPVWDKTQEAPPQLPEVIDFFDAPFLYEAPIKEWITTAKFGDRPELIPLMAQLMAHKIPAKTDLIIPVPMHRFRLWRRSFNQSALLAKGIAKITGHQLDLFSLRRIKKTPPQVGKSAEARKRNLSGAFAVKGTKINGKRIVLIDDVLTTGSTATACAKALKKAGAAQVEVVTFAYVPLGVSDF